MPNNGELRLTDGQLSWTAGANSNVVRTKRIPGIIDDGILENQLAWMINCSTRGGGIGQRPAVVPVVQGAEWGPRFQGGAIYQPDFGMPILIMAMAGRIYRVRIDTDYSVTDLTALYSAPVLPADQTHFYFKQAEMFMVIQVGDLVTKPLFYDFGVEGSRPESLRQSNGFVGLADPTNEIPPAGPMDYYAQRLWYAFRRGYAGGDISGNKTSGTVAFGYRDSVLKVTENPTAYNGDAFAIPVTAGDIRALFHASNIDEQLGEAQLFVATRRAIFACLAPVTRTAWTAADLDTEPLQKVALEKGGVYSDRAVVVVNDDAFFQSPPNGNIRSIYTTQRESASWGKVPLSNNINRVLQFNDRALLHDASGILFDNQLLQTVLPVDISGVGTGHQAIAPLDFDTISTFEERRPPAWQGVWDFSGGPLILQLFEGDFGGRERAFMAVYSSIRNAVEIWEIRPDLRFDHAQYETDGDRVTKVIEYPAYAYGDPFGLKELESGVFWLDKILGDVDVWVEYRPDGYACWIPWHQFQLCAGKDCRQLEDMPCADTGYPQERFCEQNAIPVALPKPPHKECIQQPLRGMAQKRPSTWGYQFQVRLTIRGWARVRGFIQYAIWREQRPFEGLACHRVTTTL